MYNYKKNIKVTTTPGGEVVLIMSKEIHTVLMNDLFDGHYYQEKQGLDATAKDTLELWEAIDTKDEEEE